MRVLCGSATSRCWPRASNRKSNEESSRVGHGLWNLAGLKPEMGKRMRWFDLEDGGVLLSSRVVLRWEGLNLDGVAPMQFKEVWEMWIVELES